MNKVQAGQLVRLLERAAWEVLNVQMLSIVSQVVDLSISRQLYCSAATPWASIDEFSIGLHPGYCYGFREIEHF